MIALPAVVFRRIRVGHRHKSQFTYQVVRWLAFLVRSWFAVRDTGSCGPDEPEQKLVAADEAGCEPGCQGGADWSAAADLGVAASH